MSDPTATPRSVDALVQAQAQAVSRSVSPVFGVLLLTQWVAGVWLAVTGVEQELVLALAGGGLLSGVGLLLAWRRPGTAAHLALVLAQLLWAGLLAHLARGRLEPALLLAAGLAVAAFYRDWRLVAAAAAVATAVAAAFATGVGQLLFQLGWLWIEAAALAAVCVRLGRQARVEAERRAEAELLAKSRHALLVEQNVALTASIARLSKLAEVGQLAAGIGHDLRNPIAAVRNALAYVSKRALDPNATEALASDSRVVQFLGLMDRELGVCSRMVSDLLDFARERPPTLVPCPLAALVDEAVGLIPVNPLVTVLNEVAASLPTPLLDKEQFRQALINLIQNAVEAIPAGRPGTVVIRADGGVAAPLRLTITDDGIGIPKDTLPRIFEPLFTTKARGTGLGLPIVAGMIQRHGGTISVTSDQGKGSTFQVELPPIQQAA